MKKTLLITLVALLALTLALTACGSSTSTTTEKTDTTTVLTTAGVTSTTPVSTTESPLVTGYDDAEKYVTLPALSEIKVSMAPINKAVSDYIQQVLGSLGKEDYKALDNNTAAILGDMANIYYTGRAKDPSVTLSEATLKGMSNASDEKGYDLVLGSGSFIPGFEEQLVGAKAGDTVTVDVTFPESYHSEELCGVAVLFEVKINSLSRATVSDKNVVSLIVSYALKNGEATTELTSFMKEHSTTLDLRDASTLLDESFAQEALRTALIGKVTLDKITIDLTMPLEKAKTYGYETELTLTATITIAKVLSYPETLTDADIDSYTGGEYKTVEAFNKYVTDYYKSSYAYEAISKAAVFTVKESVYNILYKDYYDYKVSSMIGDISKMTEEELAEKYTDAVKKSADEYAATNATTEYNDNMLLHYLAKKVGFVLTEEIYQKELKDLYDYYMEYYYYQMIMTGLTTIEAFESYFGVDYLRTEFLSNHVVDSLVSRVTYVD